MSKNLSYISRNQPDNYVQDIDNHLEQAKAKACTNENSGVMTIREQPLFKQLQSTINSEAAMRDMQSFANMYSEYARGSREVNYEQVCDAAQKAADHVGKNLGHEITKKIVSYIQNGIDDCMDKPANSKSSLNRY